LISQIAGIRGIERIRFSTSHPMNTTPDLIALFGSEPKLMPYFHLPVQSGSNSILHAMNRSHTAESYVEIIQQVRAVRPDVAISGDFIVGFPGETEADFEQTLALVAQVNYAIAYSFAYSPRPGTPAAAMDNQVPEALKKERLAGLQALLEAQQTDFLAAQVGKTVEVLFEEAGRNNGEWKGRTPHNMSIVALGSNRLRGQVVPVKIMSVTGHSLRGDVVLTKDA
jgi:tRNA-2-methylthio-N6-dimethylallyladenosine synthase